MTDETLSVQGAGKSFSSVKVLDDVGFALRRGEICALIGQNGSGKSTLIKILSGFHDPDPGLTVRMAGVDVTGELRGGPARTGLAFIHQDLALVPAMTILENLRITRFATGFGGRIRWRDERAAVRAALARVGLDVSPDRRLGDLSVTERALVAIARGLTDTEADTRADAKAGSADGAGGHVLVLDEPTAYLPRAGVLRLFETLRTLAGNGTSILFVSHRLDEVLENCDRALVLRGGRLVADEPVAGHTGRSLIELMIGERVERLYPQRAASEAEVAIEVTGLRSRHLEGVDFAAKRGEIVGFVGLPGGGYDQIPYALSGAVPSQAGTVTVNGTARDARTLTPGRALKHGVAMLPGDRKSLGGALGLTVGENLTLPTLGAVTGGGVLRSRAERAVVGRQLTRYGVRPARGDLGLGLLSGGNQQKVLLAKWIMAGPQVLALHEPTQGVDVGAKRDVFAHLSELAGHGTTVLVSSVEYEDLAHLCDRVQVLRDGRIVRTLTGAELTTHDIAAAVYE